MRIFVVALLISLSAAPTYAAAGGPQPPERRDAPFEFRGDIFSRPAWEPSENGRDSLKNGALIGALIGGIALGGWVGLICHAFAEEGQTGCGKATVAAAAIGAGAGAAAGAGIDALFQRRTAITVRVRF